MSHSYSRVALHLVFSTKGRYPYLNPMPLRELMHSRLAAISKQLDCLPLEVGGVEDHIHLLALFPTTISIASWVRELKRASSLWAKKQDTSLEHFRWQTGYSVFSISHSVIDRVCRYIQNQEAHHKNEDYQDEYRSLMKRSGQAIDETIAWN